MEDHGGSSVGKMRQRWERRVLGGCETEVGEESVRRL